jgi:hypothetical protein
MKPIKQNDLMRLLGPPKVGDKVEVITEISGFRGARGIVKRTWMDAVTYALIAEVELEGGTTIKFYEDVLRVVE